MTPAPLSASELELARRFAAGETLREAEVHLLCARAIGRDDIRFVEWPKYSETSIGCIDKNNRPWGPTISDTWPAMEKACKQSCSELNMHPDTADWTDAIMRLLVKLTCREWLKAAA